MADGIVTAGCMNGTVETAEPHETVVDINRMALLGGELAETACGVDEGDETGRKDLRLLKAGLYCKERHQRNENTTDDIPSTYGMPLKGEWVICASGEVGCCGGIVEQAGVDEAEALEPVDTPDELDMLVIVLIEPDTEDGADIPCVYLGGTRWHACHIEGLGNRADTSRYQPDGLKGLTDGSGGLMDALNASNSAEMAVISQGEGGGTYLHTGGAKRLVHEMDAIGCHVDAANGQTDTPCIKTNAMNPVNETDSIRMRRNCSKTRNSPDMRGIAMPKPIRQWRKVSAGDGEVYILWDAPIEALGRTLAFGEVESGRDKAIVPSLEGERAGNGNGGQREGDGDESSDGDGMASSGNVNSSQVDGVRLAAEAGQHEGPNAEMKNVPVSPRTPTDRPERPYGDVRHRRQRGRIKVETINVSQTLEVEKTYLKRAQAAQPHGNDPICAYGVIGPRCRRGCIKTESAKVSQTEKVEMTYLGCMGIAQPPWNDLKRLNRVVGPMCRHGHIKIASVNVKIECINVSKALNSETTHLEHPHATQPPQNPSRHACGVYRPRCRRSRMKSQPINVNGMWNGGNAHLGCINTICSIRKPKKYLIRLEGPTFKYRKLGEHPCNVEDYG